MQIILFCMILFRNNVVVRPPTNISFRRGVPRVQMANQSNCTQTVLWQCGKLTVAAVGERFALTFLAAGVVPQHLLCWLRGFFAPLSTVARQLLLSCTAASQLSGKMSKALRKALGLSLKSFFEAPRKHFPTTTSQNEGV